MNLAFPVGFAHLMRDTDVTTENVLSPLEAQESHWASDDCSNIDYQTIIESTRLQRPSRSEHSQWTVLR